MSRSIILTSGLESNAQIKESAEWGDVLYICAANPATAAMGWLNPLTRKVRAFVSTQSFLASASELVTALRQSGVLRVYNPRRGRLATDLVLAERAGSFRAIVACAPLFGVPAHGPSCLSVFVEGGSEDEAFVALMGWVRQTLRDSEVPNAVLLAQKQVSNAGTHFVDSNEVHEEEPASTSEDGGDEDDTDEDDTDEDDTDEDDTDEDDTDEDDTDEDDTDEDDTDEDDTDEDDGPPFLERTKMARAELVWEMLIGDGRLKRDRAVRLAARYMRDKELVQYNRLRKDGDLYQAILLAVQDGLRRDWFEERGRGYVRAVAEELEIDDWLDCLERALRYHPTPLVDLPMECASMANRYFGLEIDPIALTRAEAAAIQEAIAKARKEGLAILNEEGALAWSSEEDD